MARTQLEIFIGLLLVSIAVVVVIYVGFNEENRMAEWTLAQEAGAIEVGADLFEINCSGCHGVKGEGIPGLAPPLSDQFFFTQRLQEVGWEGTLEDYIIATVSTGRSVSTRPDQYVGGGKPAMPAWSQRFGGPLRDDQVHDLAAFVLNWEATALGKAEISELPAPTPGAEEAADPVARGQQVYVRGGCAGCHAIQGISAGVVGPNLTQIGQVAATRQDGVSAEDYIRESVVNPGAYVVEGYQPNIMPQNYGEQFSNQELDDLVAFLLAQE
ncbi:MAG: c-type cytochrome [Anaerolineales bacterium]|nr:MAG: c-type cytochrome [Anaerolineales bacterium]